MKKKIIIILSVVIVLALVVSGIIFLPKLAADKSKADSPDVSPSESATEIQKEQNNKKGEVVISNKAYSFTVMKSNFEKNFTEEQLIELSRLALMTFGVDDYYNWDGDAETVINELEYCCYVEAGSSMFAKMKKKTVDDELLAKYREELYRNMPQQTYYSEKYLTVDEINACIEDKFGPDARKFKAEDFETVTEFVESGKDDLMRGEFYTSYLYLPENNVVVSFGYPTGLLSEFAVLFDAETNGDTITVRGIVTGEASEGIETNTYEALQHGTLEYWANLDCPYIKTVEVVVGVTPDGDYYNKSSKIEYVFADTAKMTDF